MVLYRLEVLVKHDVVVILRNELGQPVMLLQKAEQLIAGAIVGKLGGVLPLIRKESLEYFL